MILAMTWTIIKLSFMLYLIIGIELAEWELKQPHLRNYAGPIGPARGYLQIVFLGPLLVVLVFVHALLATISERLMSHQHLGRDDDIRFWAVLMIAVVVLSTLLPSHGLSGR
jgi:ABC-type amino acid transport system permease subunit